jgi:UDP-glucose 4-epimerase
MSAWQDARVLVTGGAGFIGSHVVEAFTALGAHLTITDTSVERFERNLGHVQPQPAMEWGDLGELLRAGRLNLADYAVIVHLSGNPYIPPSVENPAYDFDRNLQTTFALLEAVRTLPAQRPAVIYASSAAVYGEPARLPVHESDPLVPISPYGVSKMAAERYLAVYCRLYGLRGASLRFFSVYGPRQRKQVIYDLLVKLTSQPDRVEIHGDGTQERDFCHVQDVVGALLAVLERAPLRGEAYNVASGQSRSINDVLRAWCDLLGVQPQVAYSGAIRPGETDKWSVSIDALRALGYAPQVRFEDGLRGILDWYRG